MNDEIRKLVDQITQLQEELRDKLYEQETRVLYHIEGKKVRFEAAVRQAHLELKTGLARWLSSSKLRNILSAPFIYSMITPFVLLDVWLNVYQAICFPLYRIPKVRRADYIVIDRHRLAYLNSIEKVNCVYCGYGNGLIAYAREIAARTEQYWCPIKHARKVAASHERYVKFLDYGEATDYHAKANKVRQELMKEAPKDKVKEPE